MLHEYTAIVPQAVNADVSRIPATDASFPKALREIPGCPDELFARGKLPPDALPRLAIVGTRKATPSGLATAREIARDLARRGIVVVSGLALGVDAAAHAGALDAGGTTVAVLAGGLDRVYPAEHEGLARRIIAGGGCLVSEYPPGTPTYPNQFLARNRIVSGLSLGVVIIEAPQRSGTLATARFALEQGREVFVLPGPAGHPNFAGSHRLIRDGARLIAAADEICEDLGLAPLQPDGEADIPREDPRELSKDQRIVFAFVARAREPRHADAIIAGTELPPERVYAALTVLAVKDHLVETDHGFMVR